MGRAITVNLTPTISIIITAMPSTTTKYISQAATRHMINKVT